MILTVSLNPAVDKTCEIESLKPGEVNRLLQVESVPGGKAVNVTKGLRQFKLPVMAVGFLGGNAGKFIEEMEIGYDFKDTDEIVDGSKMRLVPCYRIYLLNEDEPFTIYAYTNKAKVNTDMAQPLQGMLVLDESAVQ